MKRAIILLFVAVVTLTIVFIIYRPDILEKVWLWAVGLIGPIIGFSKKIFKSIQQYLKPQEENESRGN